MVYDTVYAILSQSRLTLILSTLINFNITTLILVGNKEHGNHKRLDAREVVIATFCWELLSYNNESNDAGR